MLSPAYQQYTQVHGLPIVASSRVHPLAMAEAAYLIDQMIGHRADIVAAMVARRTRFVIIGTSEHTTDMPEYRDLYPREWWDVRARGLGATDSRPAVSCGEENLLSLEGDPYLTENILIHEFAHAIHEMGLVDVDPTFDDRLKQAFDEAIDTGRWAGTYAGTNRMEYWAEGAQSWFNTNRTNDDLHNSIDTRQELAAYDPPLAALCKEVFGNSDWRYENPRRRLPGTSGTDHLQHFDRAAAKRFVWDPKRQQAYQAENARREMTARAPDEDVETWLRRRCAEGCFEAMVDLGRRFRDGDGVGRNHALAVRWYTKPALAGYPPAMDHLGWILWKGDPHVRDERRAKVLLERAALDGHVQAMLNMADLDPAHATRWLRMAAQQGHPRGLQRLKALEGTAQ